LVFGTRCIFKSWFQFPENSHLRAQALEGVTDILVSHNHNDYFEPETLDIALRNHPNRKLHIPKFQTTWFLRMAHCALPAFKSQIIEHEPFEVFKLQNGGLAFFVPEVSPGQVDSAIIMMKDGESLVNLNDSRLAGDELLKIKESLEILAASLFEHQGQANIQLITHTMKMKCECAA
jgi:L-ascorbate metabolism protein UlaG (beta-lactamase superfamily)